MYNVFSQIGLATLPYKHTNYPFGYMLCALIHFNLDIIFEM